MTGQTYIGELNRRIEIQAYGITYSATGQEQISWETQYCVWAKVEYPTTGSDEMYLGDQQVATTRVKFTIRYRDGLTEKHRIQYKSQYYDIRNFEETPDKAYLIINTEKRI